MARIIITNVHTREEREIDQAALPFFPDWIYTRDAVAGVPSDLPVYLSTDQFVAAVNDSTNEVGAALRAAYMPLAQAAKEPELLVTGAVVRDGSGRVASAEVLWPDGSPGAFIPTYDASGAVGSYAITYGSPVRKTFTQPTITRDANGAATNIPQIAVS